MSRFFRHTSLFLAIMMMALINSCSDNPVSTTSADMGSVTFSVKGLGDSPLAKGNLSSLTADQVTVTSARFVFEKIELENKLDSSVDFKFDEPFIQDLLSITTLAEIETFQVPFGTYDKVKVDIDDLDAQDGDVFDQNPDLQNLSIRIEGFLNENAAETFVFTSDISINIRLNMKPPLIIDETTVNSNLVLDFDYDSWFKNGDGSFIDPSVPGNQQRIERNIRESFRIFRDDNRDGRRDDNFEARGTIDAIGDNFIMVSDAQFFVTEETHIIGNDGQALSFSDLAVGMRVEVHAIVRDSGELIATRIKVQDGRDDDDDRREDFEVKAEIDSLGADFLIVGDTQVFVNDDTRIVGDNHQELTFGDLQVGMFVEVHAVHRDDGTLLATKIEVEDDRDDDDDRGGNSGHDDFRTEAPIDSLGTDFLIVAGTQVFVSNETEIKNDEHGHISFSDLAVGMFVEVRAVRREDGTLVATRIEVEDDNDDHREDVELKAPITMLGADFLIVADTQIFVNENTRIFGDDKEQLSFTDLTVGMVVEVHAIFREDSSLLAVKIEVED